MTASLRLFSAALLGLMLSACGLKGDLYLEEPEQEVTTEETPVTTEDTAEAPILEVSESEISDNGPVEEQPETETPDEEISEEPAATDAEPEIETP